MDNTISCICESLEEINEFRSILEFERFLRYISDLIKQGDLFEIPVEKSYAGFPEKWYKCSNCGEIWRLVYPDFPFKGLWIKVAN
ncbi:hypothetical protein HSX37_06810|uniref:Uncharacterized protein n=1 Tax=Dendrosporobacter quercicolus TaxID=146817 RepID=A0A1G9W0X0_9FIRM|nr:hypothetical protein [Dendrosporobacter quercicolus]NSL47753.1 hypothetical protein [Dendrosporobacter quercicolus DSM 1736]SDM77983.1 hypothetical protein SAMN04488502_10788 [Dendrosporobacter quercicolus]